MENKISTFRKENYDIITFVERKFGFYLSLDFSACENALSQALWSFYCI
jgi:hypothetical protein